MGRPPNLILGAFTAIFNVFVLALASAGIPISAELVSAVNIAAASVIAVIAFTPPTLRPGDKYHIATGNGEGNIERTVQKRDDETMTRAEDAELGNPPSPPGPPVLP